MSRAICSPTLWRVPASFAAAIAARAVSRGFHDCSLVWVEKGLPRSGEARETGVTLQGPCPRPRAALARSAGSARARGYISMTLFPGRVLTACGRGLCAAHRVYIPGSGGHATYSVRLDPLYNLVSPRPHAATDFRASSQRQNAAIERQFQVIVAVVNYSPTHHCLRNVGRMLEGIAIV
jgi:hypothetical protein